MTDKEKIREEIERLKSQLLRGACSSQIAMETRCKEEAYNEVLSFIDSLQEEPISNMWHKYSKYDKPFTGREIVVRKNNKLYYGKYTSGAYNFVFAQINIKDAAAHSYLICDILTNGDEWVYFDDTLKLSNVQRITKNWKKPVIEE